jgi:hypothetical protein
MSVSVGNDTTFPEIFQGPGIGTFLHEQELLIIPRVKVGGFDKGVDNTILSVFSGTVDTEMNA